MFQKFSNRSVDEMSQFRFDAKYEISISILVNCWKDNIILQLLNIQSLNLHNNDAMVDPNLMAVDILCLNETQISSLDCKFRFSCTTIAKI
jgi:hypothetical protein